MNTRFDGSDVQSGAALLLEGLGPELVCSHNVLAFGDLFPQSDWRDMAKIIYTRALFGCTTV